VYVHVEIEPYDAARWEAMAAEGREPKTDRVGHRAICRRDPGPAAPSGWGEWYLTAEVAAEAVRRGEDADLLRREKYAAEDAGAAAARAARKAAKAAYWASRPEHVRDLKAKADAAEAAERARERARKKAKEAGNDRARARRQEERYDRRPRMGSLFGDDGQTCWEVLGIPTFSPAVAVKAAYRRLAKEHHPDAGGDDARFVAIEGAYREAWARRSQ
jgi:hypothetical protein